MSGGATAGGAIDGGAIDGGAMDGAALLSIARTLLGLIGVCALAWVALNWLARRGIGVGRPGARLRLLERLTLGPRKQLYLVQADARVFLLGAGDAGAVSLIAELPPQPAAAAIQDARTPLGSAGG
jgi:flagellar biogenesis protein FliO